MKRMIGATLLVRSRSSLRSEIRRVRELTVMVVIDIAMIKLASSGLSSTPIPASVPAAIGKLTTL